jgi:hypothetical protein
MTWPPLSANRKYAIVRKRLIPTRIKTDAPTKKGRISFLKKRNKKLLLFAPSRWFKMGKSGAALDK